MKWIYLRLRRIARNALGLSQVAGKNPGTNMQNSVLEWRHRFSGGLYCWIFSLENPFVCVFRFRFLLLSLVTVSRSEELPKNQYFESYRLPVTGRFIRRSFVKCAKRKIQVKSLPLTTEWSNHVKETNSREMRKALDANITTAQQKHNWKESVLSVAMEGCEASRRIQRWKVWQGDKEACWKNWIGFYTLVGGSGIMAWGI